ncbi:queuosine salvage family protein [Patulibacter sp.]|uniref:queuosine salvage family protein n=1 Tax=Patulibacter sp. TaxID=1912859 RepID=UPI0027190C4B|nr:queuosine salvage family protein [Patulibacter sp.]MDO9409974.1 queuosine salvage family protein [Patulibacter sp.]
MTAAGRQSLPDRVRAHAADVAAGARFVTIDHDALGAMDATAATDPPERDEVRHFHGDDRGEVAAYVLALNAVNFGSGWFPTLTKRPHSSGYWTVAWGLADQWRDHGAWSAPDLRGLTAGDVAEVLGQAPGHHLMALYAQALRDLGAWLGQRRAVDVLDASADSAVGLAEQLVAGMPFYRDHGLYKRAQILGADLEHFGLAEPRDLDALTMFADNLVPHVLRWSGVLVYTDELAATIDAGVSLPMHRAEHEIRCVALHAVELLSARTGIATRHLDGWLWHAGQRPEVKAHPRHRCRTVFY